MSQVSQRRSSWTPIRRISNKCWLSWSGNATHAISDDVTTDEANVRVELEADTLHANKATSERLEWEISTLSCPKTQLISYLNKYIWFDGRHDIWPYLHFQDYAHLLFIMVHFGSDLCKASDFDLLTLKWCCDGIVNLLWSYVFSERYIRTFVRLLRSPFRLSVCLSVTRLRCEWIKDFYSVLLSPTVSSGVRPNPHPDKHP